MAIKIYFVWKHQMRCYRCRPGSVVEKHTYYARDALSLVSTPIHDRAFAFSQTCFKAFLTGTGRLHELTTNVRAVHERLFQMQRRLKQKLETRECKTEVLMNYWDKLIGQIAKRAFETGDEKVNLLIR